MMKKAVLTLMVLILAYPCLAKYSGGSGDPNDPYQIANVADLLTLAADTNDYNKCFIMTADIDLDPNLPGRKIFTTAVIAYDTNNSNWPFDGKDFTGVFDGASHKITNLTINTNGAGNDFLGLFGSVCVGQIRDLQLINVRITAGDNSYYAYCIGGLSGGNQGSISNCYATVTILGVTNPYAFGGLVGYNLGNISNSCSIGSINCGYNSDYLGGLVGINRGNIENSCSTGNINGGNYSDYVGVLVGYNWGGTINNCFSTGNTTGGNVAGFLGGLVGGNDGNINNSFSNSDVTGGNDARGLGGLVGLNSGYISGNISNSYSIGNVTGGDYSFNIGGLLGENMSGGNIFNCYFLATSGPDNGYGEPLTDGEMKQSSNFISWDFVDETANGYEDIWRLCNEGMEYPKLAW